MLSKVIIFFLFCSIVISAQWSRVSELEIGSTGKIAVHNESVFIYGKDNGYKLSRSDDNGQTWTDITGNAPDELGSIFSFKGKLYANVFTAVLVSEDNGNSWTQISEVPSGNNPGTIRRFSADNDILYAPSIRESIFRSVDEGNTWEEIIIDDPSNLQILNFEALGNYYFAIIVGDGLYISKDAGATWANENPSTALTGVYKYNGEIYGMSGNGIFKFDTNTEAWTAFTSGFPADGAFYSITSMTHAGNTIFASGLSILGNSTSIHYSDKGGESWTEFDNTGLPSPNAAGSNYHIAANSTNVFYFYYGLFDPENRGVYTAPHNALTSVEKNEGLPENFNLSQNYPNPFNPSTKIQFSIPQSESVVLKIYNTLGEEVAELVNQNLSAGNYDYNFNASVLPSGVYFYSIQTGSFSEIKKMMLIK